MFIGLVALAVHEARAHACSPAQPGIRGRTVWPASGRLPLNVRLVVHYDAADLPNDLGNKFPAVGSDLVLLDGAAIVPTVNQRTRVGFGIGIALRPMAPLLPNHTYQLADQRAVPCDGWREQCGSSGTPEAFATVETGDAEDTTAPAFAGIQSISVGTHVTCDSSACCGPYAYYAVGATWNAAEDEVAGANVRYRVYKDDGGGNGSLVFDNIPSTELTASALCSGSFSYGPGDQMGPGRYVVRAFDWAGNEDANTARVALGDPCVSGGGCVIGGAPPARGLGLLGTLFLLSFATLVLLRRRGARPEGQW